VQQRTAHGYHMGIPVKATLRSRARFARTSAVLTTASLLVACHNVHVLPSAPPPPAARVAPTARTEVSPKPSSAGASKATHVASTRALDEQEIGEVGELKLPPEAEPILPQLDAQTPPTTPEPDSLLSQITPSTPPNVAAAIRLIEEGRQQRNQGHVDKALERFERAVAIDPTNAYGYYFLAQLHYRQKNYDQAIAFSSRAATLSARTDRTCLGRVYSLQGAVFEEVGRYPDARKAYQRAVDADPNNLAARVGVGRLAQQNPTVQP
jgi:tetratricopeptide repeat protein